MGRMGQGGQVCLYMHVCERCMCVVCECTLYRLYMNYRETNESLLSEFLLVQNANIGLYLLPSSFVLAGGPGGPFGPGGPGGPGMNVGGMKTNE